ncbi:Aluminum-activated malate transporter 2 [Forsythia ovata]|uniref:Aluminum-activated malate transporter 2 n=1 Tax=Forsythia ovata TaxID=205694 RepID=A0ABD1X8R5_9LAMI
MASMDQETARGSTRALFKAIPEKFVSTIMDAASEGKKLGVEDPRRIIHSMKVGLAITLVSLFYYFDPLYQGFGVSAMWAVITVVVVFEFSVGATLGRGVNRGIATLLAGSLGVGAHRLASFGGERLEPMLIGLSVFFVASAVTYVRFYPKLKARYDYGFLIFILTFCLISVSGYRDDEVLDMAHKRLSTILIGGSAAVAVCILICPVWTGEDLHNLVASNVENLGIFLEVERRVVTVVRPTPN